MTAIDYIRLGYELGRIEYEPIRAADIVTAVCKYFGYQEDFVKRRASSRGVGNARKVAMYLIREKTSLTYQTIGDLFNVHRQVPQKAYKELKDTPDPRIREEIEGAEEMLNVLIAAQYDEEIPF